MLLGWLPVREHRRRLLPCPDEAVPDFRNVRAPLWHPWFPVFASYASFGGRLLCGGTTVPESHESLTAHSSGFLPWINVSSG